MPGDIAWTENGAMFVPGLVLDSPDGAKLLRGEVIDTPDGPRLLPPEAVQGDKEQVKTNIFSYALYWQNCFQMEYCVQGFDINLEEARLLLGKSKSSTDLHDLLGGVGGAVVSPEALRALAEGFDVVQSNIIPSMGEGADADNLLQEELLDAYDKPQIRKLILDSFLPQLQKLCALAPNQLIKPESVKDFFEKVAQNFLKENLAESDAKLNPSLETLRELFENSSGAKNGFSAG